MKLYLGSIAALLIFLLGAMAAHWSEIDTVQRMVFGGLSALALYMLARAIRAYRSSRVDVSFKPKYIGDIGFTLISLFDGFVIVGAIDLKAPAWLVVIGAIAAIVIGNHLVEGVKKGGPPQ